MGMHLVYESFDLERYERAGSYHLSKFNEWKLYVYECEFPDKWKSISTRPGRSFILECYTHRHISFIAGERAMLVVRWGLNIWEHLVSLSTRNLRVTLEKFIGTVRFGNDEYAAIIGYGDYKLGDTIISRVYYVEGLKHNLFSVGQFCDGGLEVAFRQHSCHIRNYDMVDLLKGSRTTNLYSISLNDMMSASPVCLLTKASSTKSWLWHRRLNHLVFRAYERMCSKI
ncbi:retrovirus-related pol polyprotein from transposon TNT 1-94 [Tanacetum coccineum]|uniref:Retrovirus-related pol polyprotein from transposon TNT 1-94 n=1 Tax=Tanacetum coccineum TaxID=301880 RepID=A0ABQ4YF99_9ASTR